MGFKTWTVGEVLASSDVMAYLMRQVVAVCTSVTRPGTVEGEVLYETDTDLLRIDDGSAVIELSRAIRGTAAVASRPAGQLINSGGSGTLISFTNPDVDTGGLLNLGASATNFVIPFSSSLWTATGAGAYGGAATGFRSIAILKNGASLGEQKRGATNTADPLTCTVPDFAASAGDIITMLTVHSQGTAITITNPTMSVRHVGRAA